MQVRLELEKTKSVNLGKLTKYSVVANGNCSGRLSIVEFAVIEPFPLGWTYINSLVVKPEERGKGIAKSAMDSLGYKIRDSGRNGILINAITIPKARKLYENLGWEKIPFDPCFHILLTENVSQYYLGMVRNRVTENIISWANESLN